MTSLLVLLSALCLALAGVVEVWCLLTGRPTISRRIQGWVHANVQLSLLLAAIAGWLLAHFSGVPQ